MSSDSDSSAGPSGYGYGRRYSSSSEDQSHKVVNQPQPNYRNGGRRDTGDSNVKTIVHNVTRPSPPRREDESNTRPTPSSPEYMTQDPIFQIPERELRKPGYNGDHISLDNPDENHDSGPEGEYIGLDPTDAGRDQSHWVGAEPSNPGMKKGHSVKNSKRTLGSRKIQTKLNKVPRKRSYSYLIPSRRMTLHNTNIATPPPSLLNASKENHEPPPKILSPSKTLTSNRNDAESSSITPKQPVVMIKGVVIDTPLKQQESKVPDSTLEDPALIIQSAFMTASSQLNHREPNATSEQLVCKAVEDLKDISPRQSDSEGRRNQTKPNILTRGLTNSRWSLPLTGITHQSYDEETLSDTTTLLQDTIFIDDIESSLGNSPRFHASSTLKNFITQKSLLSGLQHRLQKFPLRKASQNPCQDFLDKELRLIKRARMETWFTAPYVSDDKIVTASSTCTQLYQRLESENSIRILYLMPGTVNDPLICSLAAEKFENCQKQYEALSYVWGKDPPIHNILCNGNNIKIQSNLLSALKGLRFQHRPRAIWVDALCIDQDNDVEKGAQVKLMQLIYQKASRVVMWMGDDLKSQATTAFHGICLIVRHWKSFHGELRPCYRKLDKSMLDQKLFYVDKAPIDFQTWRAIEQLFSLQYWVRLWIVQEVTTSTLAIVRWGNADIAWTWIGLAATIIRHDTEMMQSVSGLSAENDLRGILNAYSGLSAENDLRGVLNAYTMFRLPDPEWNTPKLSYLDLMRLLLGYEVTREHDRAFAILGLPGQHTGDAEKQFITPNYKISLDDVYLYLAENIVATHSHPLDILSAVKHECHISGTFPSWVPRWNVTVIRSINGSHRDSMKFCAGEQTPKTRPITKWTEDRILMLQCQGIKLDTISSSTEIVNHNDICSRGNIFQWLQRQKSSITNTSASIECVCMTLTAGQDWYGRLIKTEEQLKQHLADFNAFSIENWKMMWKYSPKVAEPSSSNFTRAMKKVCDERKIFRTEEGTLGIGPAFLRPSDIICVIEGGSVPYVIRSAPGGGYFLVGECYLFGYMFGEAFHARRHGEPPVLERFEFR